MPRNVSTQVENNFIKGLVTEATSLNFPRNAATDLLDVNLSIRGKITRRKGFDYEEDYQQEAFTRSDSYICSYLWKNAAGDADTDLVVVQIGDKLYFYATQDADALSAGNQDVATVPISVNLDTYIPTGGTLIPENFHCAFASGFGDLYVANPAIDPIRIEYDSATPAVTVTQLEIKIRDTAGVDDGLETNERPRTTTITDDHRYNLYNQGWNFPANRIAGNDDEHVLDYAWVAVWVPNGSDYLWPSNADVWWKLNTVNGTSFNPANLREDFGSTPAPKGHFILNAFEPDRTNVNLDTYIKTSSTRGDAAGFGGSVTDEFTTKVRPRAIAFFAGRIWYAGVDATGFSTNLYFSQVVEEPSFATKCYQAADPTSMHVSDLVDSDGGVIKVQEAGNIVALETFGPFLIVFTTKGVWGVSGADGSGFKATDFSVNKIPGSPDIVSSKSVVNVNGAPYWWASDGIYTLASSSGGLLPTVQPLTIDTIDAFYKAIPDSEKAFVQGAYDPRTFEIKWLYKNTSVSDVDDHHDYDRLLNYNIRTQAFYPHTINDLTSGTPKVNSIVVVDSEGTIDGTTQRYSAVTKFLTSVLDTGTTFDFTFSEQKDADHRDWDTESGATGTEYTSYLETAYYVDGEANKSFQSNYVTVHTANVTNGSARVQGKWDFTNSGDSGRWSSKQEIYPSSTDRDYFSRKLKIRGHGLGLQLRFESVDRDPFEIVGWSIMESSNALP